MCELCNPPNGRGVNIFALGFIYIYRCIWQLKVILDKGILSSSHSSHQKVTYNICGKFLDWNINKHNTLIYIYGVPPKTGIIFCRVGLLQYRLPG